MPSEGYEGVVKFVFENISTLAVNACPPVLVGVGIATSVETAAVLSRKAILRPIGSRHPNPKRQNWSYARKKDSTVWGLVHKG